MLKKYEHNYIENLDVIKNIDMFFFLMSNQFKWHIQEEHKNNSELLLFFNWTVVSFVKLILIQAQESLFYPWPLNILRSYYFSVTWLTASLSWINWPMVEPKIAYLSWINWPMVESKIAYYTIQQQELLMKQPPKSYLVWNSIFKYKVLTVEL